MLKVANVIEEGRWGGPQKRISLVASKLKSHEVETVVLFSKYDSHVFQEELSKRGISFEALPLHRLGKSPLALLIFSCTFLFDLLVLVSALKRGGFDLVHVSGGAWQFKGVLAGHLAGIPVIWHLNDTSMPKVLIGIFRILGRTVAAFFVAATRTYEYYLNFPELKKHRYFSMPAPVDTATYDPGVVEADETLTGFVHPRIVSVCNLNPIKGVDVLLDAAARLKKKEIAFSMLVIGPALTTQQDYFQSLNSFIKDNDLEREVRLLGARQNIPEILKASDIYVCASRAEASPMAVWEAMAMELPVISTDVGDVKHYLQHGQNGIIISPESPDDLTSALETLISDSDLRNSYGHSARGVVVEKLDVGVIAKMTATAYKEVVRV